MPTANCNCNGGTTPTNGNVTAPTVSQLSVSTSSKGGVVHNVSGSNTNSTTSEQVSKSVQSCSSFTSHLEPDSPTQSVVRDCLKGYSNAVNSTAPSLACDPKFRKTTTTTSGFIFAKSSPLDQCMKHMTSEDGGFLVDKGKGQGQEITHSPEQNFPIAQGYYTDVMGNFLTDSSGSPVLAPAPLFSSITISDVNLGEESLDKRLFNLRAPNTTVPSALYAINGSWVIGELYGDGFCSTKYPTTSTSGRMLIIDAVEGSDDQWCIKEFAPTSPSLPYYDSTGNLNSINLNELSALSSGTDCASEGFLKFKRSCSGEISHEWFDTKGSNLFVDTTSIDSLNEDDACNKSGVLKVTKNCNGTITQSFVEGVVGVTETQSLIDTAIQNLTDGNIATVIADLQTLQDTRYREQIIDQPITLRTSGASDNVTLDLLSIAGVTFPSWATHAILRLRTWVSGEGGGGFKQTLIQINGEEAIETRVNGSISSDSYARGGSAPSLDLSGGDEEFNIVNERESSFKLNGSLLSINSNINVPGGRGGYDIFLYGFKRVTD